MAIPKVAVIVKEGLPTKSCWCNSRKLQSKRPKNNSSGHKGVSQTASGKWLAYISLKGKRHNLGIFTKKSEAILARKLAERRLFQPILQQEIVTTNKEV